MKKTVRDLVGGTCKECKHYATLDNTLESLCLLFTDRELSEEPLVTKTHPNSGCECFIKETRNDLKIYEVEGKKVTELIIKNKDYDGDKDIL